MDRREELKAKARDHERKDQPEHALEVYLSLVPETPSSGRGGLWTRIGDLQERIGAASNAIESFSLAARAFAENGQLNNAVAICQRILALDPRDAASHLRLGELSLTQGYREYARSGIGDYARLTAAAGRPEAAIEPLTTFLGRYPAEVEVWSGWEEELRTPGRESELLPLLERLRESMVAGGHAEAVEQIGRKLAGMRSAPAEGGAGEDGPAATADDAPGPEQGLPLLDNRMDGGADTGSIAFTPLAGLEPTGGESYSIEEPDSVDDLPLLGNLPDMATDRPHRTDLEAVGPLDGMERFEVVDGVSDAPMEKGIADDAPWAGLEVHRPGDEAGFEDLQESDGSYGDDIPLLVPDVVPGQTGATARTTLTPAFDPARIATELRDHAGIDVEPGDPDSHYDLGLAYKEMDRFDESLANLASAIDGGHDPAAVLEVAAEILVRKGEHALANGLLRQLPGVGERPAPEHLGVHYWLARASEEAGRHADARRALELVVAVDPRFRDASERLRNLV